MKIFNLIKPLICGNELVQVDKLTLENEQLSNKIESYMDKENERLAIETINNKYPKSDITWIARNGRKYDVRNFIFAGDTVLKNVLAHNNLKGKTHDESAFNCFMFILKNIKYKSDLNEDWKYPVDTYYDGYGDCEDFTNLLISLILNCNVPSHRIKNCCGYAIDNQSNKIGHSYPIYLRELDNEWIDLDCTFYPESTEINKRPLVKNNKKYGEIWFTFNSQFSWSKNISEEILGRVKQK